MRCIPCRTIQDGQRFQIDADGRVFLYDKTLRSKVGEAFPEQVAARIRKGAARQRRNRNARERNEALRSLGLVKTPYGWE